MTFNVLERFTPIICVCSVMVSQPGQHTNHIVKDKLNLLVIVLRIVRLLIRCVQQFTSPHQILQGIHQFRLKREKFTIVAN